MRITSTLPFIILGFISFALSAPAAQTRQAALSKYDAQLVRIYTQTAHELVNNSSDELIDSGIPEMAGPIILDFPENTSYKIYFQLHRALDRLPKYTKPVYRGLYSSKEKNPEDRYFTGKVWRERRFSSATKSHAVAENFSRGAYKAEFRNHLPEDRPPVDPTRSIFIQIDPKKSARDIEKYSAIPEEQEVLLKPGVFKVVHAGRDETGRYLVHIQELDPNKLTPEDATVLNNSEQERLARLIKELGPEARDLTKLVNTSNDRHRAWKKSGYLEKNDLNAELFLGE